MGHPVLTHSSYDSCVSRPERSHRDDELTWGHCHFILHPGIRDIQEMLCAWPAGPDHMASIASWHGFLGRAGNPRSAAGAPGA